MLHADMLFVDHGIFRTIYLNKHKLDGEAIRAAQPTPGQIRRLARRGLRTMVNLRGERDCGSYWLEKQACDEAGIVFETFRVRSRAAPTPEEVLGACELFRRVEYPMLMHCKSGADRVGLMSVLYQFVHCGVPLETAKRQLSLRYGHIRQAQTGVLDYFFETYMAYNQSQPIDFLEWVSTVYDHKAVMAEFRSHSLADKLVDGVLRRE
ncbi:MAG: sulfur transferase domain-containing protein [Pseudomonadota bacterium]